MSKNKKTTIFGFHPLMIVFMILISFVHLYFLKESKLDSNGHPETLLWHPLLTPLFFLMILGFTLDFIGKSIPILNKLGLGFILCILIPSYFVHKEIIPSYLFTTIKSFFVKPDGTSLNQGLGINFAQFFVIIVVSGSISSVDRNLLKRSITKFIPLALFFVFFSFVLVGFLGILLNYQCPDIFKDKSQGSFWDAILFICVPLTNGGTNLGIAGFANGVLKDAFPNLNNDDIRTAILTPLIFARTLSIILAGIITIFFNNTKFSGRGQLEKNKNITDYQFNKLPFYNIKNNKTNKNINYQNLGMGLLIILTFYSTGCVINYFFYKKYIFKLDAIVYAIILLLIIKLLNLIPNYQKYISQTGKFIETIFTVPVLAGLGLITKWDILIKCLKDYKICLMVVTSLIVVIIFSFMLASYFNFYALELALTAGISSHSIGGPGNIGVMTISNRMDLLPFAMISTRLVGVVIFVLATFLIKFKFSI